MANFYYRTFVFKRPALISLGQYESLKMILLSNPAHKIKPPGNDFFVSFKSELAGILAGLLGGIILEFNFNEFLNVIGGILAFLSLGFLLSFIISFFSYLHFMWDKFKYYKQLKKDIIKTNSYDEFILLQEKRRWQSY